MKATGRVFANLGPFKVVFELVSFQRLCAVLARCARDTTTHAWADSFKCALTGFVGSLRLRSRRRLRLEARREIEVEAKAEVNVKRRAPDPCTL